MIKSKTLTFTASHEELATAVRLAEAAANTGMSAYLLDHTPAISSQLVRDSGSWIYVLAITFGVDEDIGTFVNNQAAVTARLEGEIARLRLELLQSFSP